MNYKHILQTSQMSTEATNDLDDLPVGWVKLKKDGTVVMSVETEKQLQEIEDREYQSKMHKVYHDTLKRIVHYKVHEMECKNEKINHKNVYKEIKSRCEDESETYHHTKSNLKMISSQIQTDQNVQHHEDTSDEE